MTAAAHLRAWLHRKGIARTLNSRSNNLTRDGGAYVEARGPRWAARWLALYTVRHDPLCRADWLTVRVTRTEQVGRGHYRFQTAYRRLP